MGLELASVGGRVVAYVEREAYAANLLVARMEKGDMGPSPVWSDVSTFNGRPFRGLVDGIAGGFPCQDISHAGKKVGIEGERSGLWSQFARIIGEVQPRLVVIENVASLRSKGLEVVLRDLASLGFDAEWGTLGADAVGAPHGRERLFIVAYSRRERGQLQTQWRHAAEQQPVRAGRDLFPPPPSDRARWTEIVQVRPDLEPSLRRMDDELAYWVDRCRLTGNGVVPLQAAAAVQQLLRRCLTTLPPINRGTP